APTAAGRARPDIGPSTEATPAATGRRDVTVQRSTPETDPDEVTLAGAEPTIRNIRLWDPAGSLAGQAFEQLQRVRNYYGINDIDVDRYVIDGRLTQVNIGARTINTSGVPGDSWEASHLAYTHGYGIVLAPSNASQGTDPEFLVGDVPPVVDEVLEASGFTLDQPRIYFGEDLDGY